MPGWWLWANSRLPSDTPELWSGIETQGMDWRHGKQWSGIETHTNGLDMELKHFLMPVSYWESHNFSNSLYTKNLDTREHKNGGQNVKVSPNLHVVQSGVLEGLVGVTEEFVRVWHVAVPDSAHCLLLHTERMAEFLLKFSCGERERKREVLVLHCTLQL